jgi:hypothetical protein
MSLLEIGKLVLETIFKNVLFIFTLLILSPFEEGVAPHLNNFESVLINDDLCQLWLKLVQRFCRSGKCKSDRQQATRKAHLSFQLR